MLPKWFKDYLSFHKSERRGIIVLVILLFGLISYNIYQRFFWKSDWETAQIEFGDEMVSFQAETKERATYKETPKPWLPKEKNLFDFDPNTLDSTGWVGLGFSPKQAAAIINYRSAGAVFRKPEDLKKLFVVDEEKYEELKPFVQITEIPEKTSTPRAFNERYSEPKDRDKPTYEPVVIELNSADSSSLVQVRGIGPFFARVIIEHREKLGGYRSKEQVLEVYGMDSTKFARIKDQLMVDSTQISKIDLNSATIKELVHHPYINFNQAKAIVKYREQHGHFKTVAQLQKVHLVKGETYRKIAPYFKVP